MSEKFEFNTDISKFKINEVQVANIDQFIDHSYNYGAWIELYNADDVQHSLDKAILRHTDNDGVIDEYAFGLSHGMLASKGFATLWFDHHNTQGTFGGKAHLQIPFKLDPDGGTIELLDTKGEVIDAVDYPPAIARCAYARTEDGAGEWGWTAQATPKKSNAGVTFSEERLPAPEVNTESTLFTRSITFKVNIPAGATLRYTKDGSTPTATNGATSRAGAFTTQETPVYRFVLIADGMLPSPVVTRTFIKDENDLEIPVLVLAQLNREVDKATGAGSRPKLAHLRESGTIEQDADIVSFLHRDREESKGAAVGASVEAEWIIEKNRNGRTGNFKLLFYPSRMEFLPAAPCSEEFAPEQKAN